MHPDPKYNPALIPSMAYLVANNIYSVVLGSGILEKGAVYWLDVTDVNNCEGRDSIVVSPKQCLTGFYVPTAFTPNNDGKNDLFKPLIFGNVVNFRFVVYNRWGQVIFQSTDPSKGWDGNLKGKKQDSQAFIWTCNYQFDGEKQEYKKGMVLLIR